MSTVASDKSADAPASEIGIEIEQVRSSVVEFDRIAAGLAAIEAEHPRNVACAVDTPAGMRQAVAGRAAWREPRLAVEKARKEAKAPVLKLGKTIDRFAADLTTKLLAGEEHYDEQIKAEEGRREADRQRRLQEIAEKMAALRREIVAAFGVRPLAARGMRTTADQIGEEIRRIEAEPLSVERFGDLEIEAAETKRSTLEWLAESLSEANRYEAEQADLARQRAELAAQREADREQREKREAEERVVREAEAVERRRLEDAERAAHHARMEAERRRADEARAAHQAEADRLAALTAEVEAREQAIAEAEAAQQARERQAREAAEKAEAERKAAVLAAEQRQRDEEQAAERLAAADRLQSLARVEAAAPQMLDALRGVAEAFLPDARPHLGGWLRDVIAAIDAAEGDTLWREGATTTTTEGAA